MTWITVTLKNTQGSTPRDAGTSMRVFSDRIDGTIGGGMLEWEAMRIAREMLANGASKQSHKKVLGPDLGQCCGGVVSLHFEREAPPHTTQKSPLWIWGAGHVGRAIAALVAPFEDRTITLIDTAESRFPASLTERITPFLAEDPPKAVHHAPEDAHHLIVTFSHEIDLALCDALLRRPTQSIGLIGSATKWARFRKRLREMGHSEDDLARITCPIGEPALGKHPQAVALGVIRCLLLAEQGAKS